MAMNVNQRIRHYKGGLYVVIATAKLEATEELMYVYRNEATGETWVRPQAEFDDIVEWQGQRVTRFTVVE